MRARPQTPQIKYHFPADSKPLIFVKKAGEPSGAPAMRE